MNLSGNTLTPRLVKDAKRVLLSKDIIISKHCTDNQYKAFNRMYRICDLNKRLVRRARCIEIDINDNNGSIEKVVLTASYNRQCYITVVLSPNRTATIVKTAWLNDKTDKTICERGNALADNKERKVYNTND